MNAVWLVALLTGLSFATAEPRVSRASLTQVEASINDRFRSSTSDPYDLLGTARGTYVEGYGALFTVELSLVYVPALSPFRPTITKEEVASLRERKLRKLVVLKEQMRDLMVNASSTMNGVPGNERIAMEAFLWNYKWENAAGLPHRIILSAEKQQLQAAKTGKAADMKIFQEQEL